MSVKVIDSNQVTIAGKMIALPVFSHKVHKESFYTLDVKVKRSSGAEDILPVIIPDRLMDVFQRSTDGFIKVNGQYRSCNKQDGCKGRLLLYVFAKEIEITEKEPDADEDNCIILSGYICKTTIFRKTPLGRWITDMILAVNRPCRVADYIPCICWGANAALAQGLETGSHIKITGRIQSREYIKKLTETESEKRIAYEVSIKNLDVIT